MDINIPIDYKIASSMHLISLMTGISETRINVYVTAYRSVIQTMVENGATIEEVTEWFISEASDNPDFLRCTIDEELDYEQPTRGEDISTTNKEENSSDESSWEPSAEVFKVDTSS